MTRVRRIGVVTVGLAVVGAATGGVLAAAATAGLLVVARGPYVLTGAWDVIGVFGLIGAAVGAVLAPLTSLFLLRHVPLGRALTGTALGTAVGAAVGIAFSLVFSSGYMPPILGAVLGFAIAAIRLRRQARAG